jgi:hypothetical protein
MLNIRAFMEKNGLCADEEKNIEKLEAALKAKEPAGLVCKGQIGGMAPAGLEMLGINTIFPNGIYISLHPEAKCSSATLTLIPKVLVLGLDLASYQEKNSEMRDKAREEAAAEDEKTAEARTNLANYFSEAIEALLDKMQYYPQALAELAVDEVEKESFEALALEELAKEKNWQISYYKKEEWELCTEPLSEMDKMIGKTADDAVCERLARCGAGAEGKLLTKQMESKGLCLAAAEKTWNVLF